MRRAWSFASAPCSNARRSFRKRSRQLIRLRYFENRSYKEISESIAWTVEALYVAFNRIHKALSECVQRRMEVLQG